MRNARLSTIIIAITLIAIVVSAAPATAQMGVWRDINPDAYISPPANPQLNSIYMLSPGEGWAVGDSLPTTNTTTGLPAIFHYDGSTWNIVPAPKIADFPSTQSAYNLTSVTFGTPGNPISVNDGWAVGYNATTSGTIGTACGTGPQTDTVGGTTKSAASNNNLINGEAIVASQSGTLASIGVNVQTAGGNARVAIYSTLSASVFSGLLGQSADTPLTTGWNDIPVTGVTLAAGTTYYIALNLNSATTSIYYATSGTNYYVAQAYGPFPPTTSTLTTQPSVSINMRITYTLATTCAQALHWDGVTWRTETAGLTGPDSAQLWSAFMVTSTDVWAVGQNTAGNNGVFWHWTGIPGLGGGWNMPQAPVPCPTSVSAPNCGLYSVFMVSPTEGWAVGAGGIIFHYFGGAWNTFTSPVICTATSCPALRSIYMISPTEGWAVGDGGIIIHYSSGTWSGPVSPGTTSNDLFSVFMVSSTEGWAFGAAGTILHYSGGTWTALSPNLIPTSPVSLLNFNSGFFNSANDGWVVGTDGVVLHFDGVNYGTITSPTINNFTSISFGPPLTGPINPNDGWAVGNASVTTPYEPTIYHWNGFAWTKGVAIGTMNNLNSVFMINTGDVWTVGGGPQSTSSCSGPLCPVILHFTGASWNTVAPPPGSYLLKSIFMVGSAEGWAVGEQVPSCSPSLTCYPTGILLHYTVSGGVGTWAIFPAPSSPATQPIHGLNSVFMLDQNEGWAVGDNATILHYTVSGGIGTWNLVTVSGTPSLSADANLTSIFMLSASSGWAVGGIQAGYSFSAGPVIIYWDGTKWEPVAAPSVPGGITPTGHTSAMLKSVFFSAPDDGWAVGFPGKNVTTTLHWDGVSWRHVSLSPALLGQVPPILTSVYMTSETDGWIVGGSPDFNYCTTSPNTCYFSQARPAPTDLRPASQLVPSVGYKTPLSTMLRFAPYGGVFSTTSTSILLSTASTSTTATTTTISSTVVPVCPPNVTISIKAVDNQGNPISGVNVVVAPPGFTSCLPSSLQAATNSQGLVTFTLPANWTYSIALSKAGVSSTQSILPSSTGQVFSLTLNVSPGGLIPGFPLESILAGIVLGVCTLVLLRRRRHAR